MEPEAVPRAVANRIIAQRAIARRSRCSLAQDCGWYDAKMKRIEDTGRLRVDELWRIAQVLGCDPYDLLPEAPLDTRSAAPPGRPGLPHPKETTT